MPKPRKKAPEIDPVQAREILLSAITASTERVPLSELAKLPEIGGKLTKAKLKVLLQEDLKSSAVTLWTIERKDFLWTKSRQQLAGERLLDIGAEEIPASDELAGRAAKQSPAISSKVVMATLKQLVTEGELKEVPAAAGAKKKRLIRADRPEAYLTETIAPLLEKFGVHRSAEQILAFLGKAENQAGAEEQKIREAANLMLEAMNRIAFSRDATVTFYRLREQPELAALPKAIFDRAALLLQDERKVLLSVHDHAPALPNEERESLVTDGLGHFYVSLYAR